jgi:hypothetical protein
MVLFLVIEIISCLDLFNKRFWQISNRQQPVARQ